MTIASISPEKASADPRNHRPAISAKRPWIGAASGIRRDRAARVTVLIVVAAALGLADLGVTLHFMTTTGMCEANQLARAVASGGPGALIAFKLASIAVFASLLYACRRRWSAEIGAWIAVAVMAAVMASWVGYARAVDDSSLIVDACRDAWVRL